jgi:hypothetical protein
MKDKNNVPLQQDKDKPVHERTGSTLHDDYKIQGDEEKHRDEKESYGDYNGNSEENNPARAEQG